MFMGLLSSWPGSLIDVPIDDEPRLDCCRIFHVVFEGSLLAKVAEVLMILLVVMYASRPG